jgi:hypothetical protein
MAVGYLLANFETNEYCDKLFVSASLAAEHLQQNGLDYEILELNHPDLSFQEIQAVVKNELTTQ